MAPVDLILSHLAVLPVLVASPEVLPLGCGSEPAAVESS